MKKLERETKSLEILVRVSPTDKKEIEEQAIINRMSVGQYMRYAHELQKRRRQGIDTCLLCGITQEAGKCPRCDTQKDRRRK